MNIIVIINCYQWHHSTVSDHSWCSSDERAMWLDKNWWQAPGRIPSTPICQPFTSSSHQRLKPTAQPTHQQQTFWNLNAVGGSLTAVMGDPRYTSNNGNKTWTDGRRTHSWATDFLNAVGQWRILGVGHGAMAPLWPDHENFLQATLYEKVRFLPFSSKNCKIQQCLMVFCISKFQKHGRICGFHWTFRSKKCFSFRGASPPWPPDQGLCPWTTLGAPPPDPRYSLMHCALAMAPLLLNPKYATAVGGRSITVTGDPRGSTFLFHYSDLMLFWSARPLSRLAMH